MKKLLKTVGILVVAYIVVTLVWKALGTDKLKELLPQVETEEISESTEIDEDSIAEALASDDHLKFKGVPIDGTLDRFVALMSHFGFYCKGKSGGKAELVGDFADYKDCTLRVSTLTNKDLVYNILVIFPYCDSWEKLHNNYTHLKSMLTEKYGGPTSCIEKFQFRSYEKSWEDGEKMYAVKDDRCTYQSEFQTDKGSIKLYIGNFTTQLLEGCCVALDYRDSINSAIIKEHAIDDL